MQISADELAILNFYRASELHGGLVLGEMARRAREPGLMRSLTTHAAEEVAHAAMWTEAILDVGGRPSPTRDTYQARYAAALGAPATMLDVLALTQVFERRVYRHFTEHLRSRETHPAVRATLERMLEEEKGHLAWVKRWLDAQAERGAHVDLLLRRYAAVDTLVYEALLRDYRWRRAAA
ncbi:MAG TPA: ferritin family protein [Gemmatimonadaceae bacterium]|nr:ferritin family protein [Gemmatimonadaceae bacterium]